jgi:MSHA biogenesis protein MshN
MLQDLEARQSHTDEIKADYQAPAKKQSKLLVLLLLMFAIAAIIFALTDIDRLFGDTNKNVATTNTQSLPSNTSKKMTMVSEKVPVEPVQSQTTVNKPTNEKLEIVTTDTKLDLSRKILADEQTQSQTSKAATPKLDPQQTIATQDKPLKPQTNAELATQEATESPSSFSMTGSSQKNNSSSLKQRIVESLNDNDLDLAGALLYELLETEPDNIKARKKLASLLFAQGNYVQSEQLLIQGIELHPAKSDLRLMLARLYVVQKEPSQAMNILSESQPITGIQAEFLGYRAALAQQLKQTKLAQSDYQTLTNIESTNAKWWLGLAIAEDQLGNIKMAVQAYKKAKSLEQLESSVNDFMQQRISVLAGAQ